MNDFSFTRNDTNAAKIGGASRISQTGAYEGVITRAEPVKKPSGVVGIEIDFKSQDGASALFMDLYTQNGKGEELSGRRIVDALMLCLRVKSMQPSRVTVDKWDKNAGGMTKQAVDAFVELMGKPIGLVLQKEHSTYNGQPRERMIIYACYDIASRKTPQEIVNRAPQAKALDAILANLGDRHEKPKAGQRGYDTPGPRGQEAMHPAFDSMADDDIPY